MDETTKNYYEILETPYDSTEDEIERNYAKARNAYAADSLALYSLMSEDDCKKMLETIDEAYSILSDINKRRLYDQARGIKNSRSMRLSEQDMVASHPIREGSASLDKMIAKNIFSLNYTENSEMEKKIEQSSDFTGAFLKEIREYKNVTINKLAEMTKISKNYIRYIEEDVYEHLPAPVYVRGFVYQYAKSLKLNPDLVANSYLDHMKNIRKK